MNEYTSLGKLVGQTFTVKGVQGYKFKLWDTATNHMVTQDNYFEGASKKWQLDTDKGTLDLGTGQMGNLLEAVMKSGVSDINDQTFEVKSNGKTGMDIRYYLNPVKDDGERAVAQHEANRDEAIDEDPFAGIEL